MRWFAFCAWAKDLDWSAFHQTEFFPSRSAASHGSPRAPVLPAWGAVCYSLKITLKRPLLTVNAPFARIVDKAHRPELVHEMTDPRPRSTDHLGQVFLIDSGMDRFDSAFLAKMCQQQENSGQAFLAGVEQR